MACEGQCSALSAALIVSRLNCDRFNFQAGDERPDESRRKQIPRPATGARTLAAGFVLGAGAIQALHAQAKPPACLVAKVNVRDKTGYEKEFLPPTLKTMKEAGGKYLAGGFDKAVGLSGLPPANRRTWTRPRLGTRAANVSSSARSAANTPTSASSRWKALTNNA